MKQLFTLLGLLFFYISHSQNVGIGTDNPVAKLHIKGNTTEVIPVQDGFEDNSMNPPYNFGGIGTALDGPGNWFISTNANSGTLGLQVPVSTSANVYEVFTYPVDIPSGRKVTINGFKKHPNLSFSQIAVAVGSDVQFLSTSNFLNIWQAFSLTFETTEDVGFVYFGYKSTLGGTSGLQLFFDDIEIKYDEFTGDTPIRIQDGSEAEGKVLVSDALGGGTWKDVDEIEVDKLINGDDTLRIYDNGAVTWGEGNEATGELSTAWGDRSIASGFRSTSWGLESIASGILSTAWGLESIASGDRSTAWGWESTASGILSTAWGYKSTASQNYSTAWGNATTASGSTSTAWGSFTNALGSQSTAFGNRTMANTNLETALGRQNYSPQTGDPFSWIAIDQLFSIGNGLIGTKKNAITILKNGNIGLDSVHHPTYRLELPNNSTANKGKAIAVQWKTFSDGRIKTKQQKLEYGLKEVLSLQPKSYNQHSSSSNSGILEIKNEYRATIGLIAQEVYTVIPEAVSKPQDETKELWSMDYEKLIPVLIQAIQEQQAIIAEQEKEITAMVEEMKIASTTEAELMFKYDSLHAEINALRKMITAPETHAKD